MELDGELPPVARPRVVIVGIGDPVLGALQAQRGWLHGEKVPGFPFGQVMDEAKSAARAGGGEDATLDGAAGKRNIEERPVVRRG
jgi:hypothetical protein